MTLPRTDLTGQVFGRLTVVARQADGPEWNYWHCQCSCGNTRNVRGYVLKMGKSQSCGCLRAELRGTHSLTHGQTNSPEYRAWENMWKRCTNPNHEFHDKYKERTPPESWRDFTVFLQDVGKRPTPEHTLDRIRNEEPYGPGNCRWATRTEQARNRSSTIWIDVEGGKLTKTQFAEYLGISPPTLRKLMKTKTTEELINLYRSK